MEFLDEINTKTLLICDPEFKIKVLEYLNKNNKIIDLKIMSKQEFLNHYFFSYSEKVIYYVKNKYKITREIACIYLDNLKYVIDSNLNNKKVIFLKELYQDLKENNYLDLDILFKNYLENINIIVLDKDQYDNFTLNIFNKYNTRYIDLNNNKRRIKNIYHFKTIEDEVEFNFNKISELIKNNISIKNIKIVILGEEYKLFLKRFSYLYNISLNNLEKNSIYATMVTKTFLNHIKSNKTKEEIFEYIENIDNELKEKFINIINKYFFIDNLNDVIDFIEYDLKNTYFKEFNNNLGIDIIPLNSNLIKDDDYVFIMGFNIENIPKTYKDIDFFNDSLKKELGLFTSIENNIIEKLRIIKNINSINNIFISYKDIDPYNSYYPSNLIEELGLVLNTYNNINLTSNLYNKIKLTKELDQFLKYGTKFESTPILLNTYKNINYLKYSNIFKPINNFNIDNITLSYTSLNNYFHCAFRYYIDSILKLNIFEESFKQFIGNLFHFILSKMYDKDFNFEKEWNNYLENKQFTKKELFYLKDLKEELKKIIEVINYQYSLTGLTNVKLETKIDLSFNDKYKFVGIIDKIMFKEKDNNTYISIIDYKTGIPKVNINNLQYGIDMQLPIYVYLLMKSNLFNNPKIIGFYLEQIIHERSSYDKANNELEKYIDNLKLQGYTINDPYLVSMFDESYENSMMIKSMKTTSKGFSHYTKIINDDEIKNLVDIVDNKIKEAFDLINNGEFTINPKVIDGENIGCSFCKYQDLCFKTGKDLIYLKEENLDYLKN